MTCYCDYYEGEAPSFFTETLVTARKPHTCVECLEPIKVGERYELCRGMWEGKFRAYKTCAHCADMRHDAGTGDPYFEGIAFGQLACWYAGVIANEAEQMDREAKREIV